MRGSARILRAAREPVARARGTHDYFADESPLRVAIAATFARLAHARGFAHVETPVLEPAALFARSLGDGSDVVAKEMYTLCASPAAAAGDAAAATLLALRPEGTAGIMRALIGSGRLRRALHPSPQKLFYAGPMFRHERPQRGRFRQFTQLGVEVVGGASAACDAECISLAFAFLRSVLAPPLELTLLINSLGDEQSMQRYGAALQMLLEARRDQLSPESRARLDRGAVLRVLDSKSLADQSIVRELPQIADYLGPAARRRFDDVLAGLETLGVACVVEPRLVRGLDYYSHTVFEFVASAGGAAATAGDGAAAPATASDTMSGGAGHLGTVLAGGRYDRLAVALGHPEHVPSIGWAAGLERLCILAAANGGASAALAEPKPLRVAVLPLLPRALTADAEVEDASEATRRVVQSAALRLAAALLKPRAASPVVPPGSVVVLSLEPEAKLARLLGAAAAAGADFALIVAEDELRRGV